MITKAVTEVLDYVEDYSAEMAATSPNDSISSSSWSADMGLQIGTTSKTGTTTTVWLEGGRAYTYATLVNTIVTAAGRTYERTQVVEVRPIVCG